MITTQCLQKDIFVFTLTGIKSVSEIKNNEKILTENDWIKVNKTINRK